MAEHFTVGSLIGVPLGATRPERVATVVPPSEAPAPPDTVEETEGPNWTVSHGAAARRGSESAWRGDGVEALTFNNPFGQVMERVWFDGKVVFAVDLGRVAIDTEATPVAQEYQPVYTAELDERGCAVRPPETVPGQLNIYDTVPGMDRYSPIWQFNYVIVPRTYAPNALRSERDCLNSGYPILKSNDFEN